MKVLAPSSGNAPPDEVKKPRADDGRVYAKVSLVIESSQAGNRCGQTRTELKGVTITNECRYVFRYPLIKLVMLLLGSSIGTRMCSTKQSISET